MSRPGYRGPHAPLSEALLRVVVRDTAAQQGLLGDLAEEADRAATAGRPFNYGRAVRAVAFGYLRARRRGSLGVRAEWPAGEREGPLAGWLNDFVSAARILRRRRAYTAAVAGTLALGFGAATAVLSVAYGVWYRPLPFGDPDGLVRVYEVKLDGDTGSMSGDTAIRPSALDAEVSRRSRMSPPLLHDLRAQDFSALDMVASVAGRAVDWSREDVSIRLSGVTASRGIFRVLQLRPVAGRFFSPEPGSREVVVSEGFWRRELGGDAAAVGTAVMDLDGEPHLLVGVAPDDLPYPQAAGDVWVPSDPEPDQLIEGMRGARYLDVVARLRPGASPAAAATELDGFVRGLGADHPHHAGWGATVVPLRADLVRPFTGIVRLLVAAALLFLALSCANVLGLVAARRTRDRGERRMRRALGASAWRTLRLDVAELLVLTTLSLPAAAVLAAWALAPLRGIAPADIPRIAEIRLDPVVVGGLAVTAWTGAVALAVLTHLLGGRVRLAAGADSGRTTALAARGRAFLTVLQVAATTVLLVGGGALADHFRDLARVDTGFDAATVMTTQLVLGAQDYEERDRRRRFFEELVAGLQRRGQRAAYGTNPPVAGVTMRFGYRAGHTGDEQHWGQYHTASPGYFEILGIPLVAGRVFTPDDHAEAEPVAIISAALAAAHFDTDPVGQDIEIVGTRRRIVGVVGTVRHFGPDQAPPTEMYVPAAQDPWLLGHVLVAPGEGFDAGLAREIGADIDAAVPIQALFPYTRFIRTWFAPLRFQLAVVGLLAGAGTVLALVGLYALIAYVVAARTRELGIRLALGECARRLFRSVVTRGITLAGAGLVLGTAVALSLRGFLRSLGTGIEADDPTVLVAVALLVLLAAGSAAAWPARRAARIDPASALRHD